MIHVDGEAEDSERERERDRDARGSSAQFPLICTASDASARRYLSLSLSHQRRLDENK